jgi:hypothetical protein
MSEAARPANGPTLRKIRLELARTRGSAEGSSLDAYEFVAPLDENDHIDLEAWRERRPLCFVHRIEGGRIVERGVLVHRAGGAGGATWAFDYEPGGGVEEETGFRFGAHAFTPGEYVSIRDENGEPRTYRVAKVTPA